MIKIRRSVFETNSSSAHSLVVKKNGGLVLPSDVMSDLYITPDGVLEIYDDEIRFDRAPFRMLISPVDKMLYLVASFADDEEKCDEIINIFLSVLTDIKSIKFPSLYIDEYEPCYGYVDHESRGMVVTYLEKNNIDFKDFIFSNKYVVIIDGDEYGIWEIQKESGLIDLDEIEVDINPYNYNY